MPKQVAEIAKTMARRDPRQNILITRADAKIFSAVKRIIRDAKFHRAPGVITVERNREITVTYQDEAGAQHKLRAGDDRNLSELLQHEIDHLDGIRFPSRIQDMTKLHWVEKEEFPLYRNQEGWRTWPKLCSREKCQEILKDS